MRILVLTPARISATIPMFHFSMSAGSAKRTGTLRKNCMNILLLSMPDYFEHMPPVAVCMPNGALTSLAGNVDSHHRVGVADLILVHCRVRESVIELVR